MAFVFICSVIVIASSVYSRIRYGKIGEKKHDTGDKEIHYDIPQIFIRIDSKDFVDAGFLKMNPEQITAIFDGLKKLASKDSDKS